MRGRPNPRRVRREMHRHRHIRHMRAILGGYFWLPCDRCGTKFGGDEWIGRFNIRTETAFDEAGNETWHSSRGMCPGCEADMGLIGFELCRRSGHEWTWTAKGKSNNATHRDGSHTVTIDLDMNDREWYCANCGIDQPGDDK